jgi:hypothetical protein
MRHKIVDTMIYIRVQIACLATVSVHVHQLGSFETVSSPDGKTVAREASIHCQAPQRYTVCQPVC